MEALIEEVRFAVDSPVEGGVSCELVSEMPNSLLAGKIQGNSPIRSLAAPRNQRKRARNQFLTSQFPTHSNREFFAALQGIKSGDRGSFRRDQGIPLSSAIWHSPLVTNPIIGAVGRVARARVQRAHRRWGTEGSNPSPSTGRRVPRGCTCSSVFGRPPSNNRQRNCSTRQISSLARVRRPSISCPKGHGFRYPSPDRWITLLKTRRR